MIIKYEEKRMTLEPEDTDPRDKWFLESLGIYKNKKVHAFVRTVPGRYEDKLVIELTEWIPREPDYPVQRPAVGGQSYRRPAHPTQRKEPNGNEA